MFAQKSLVPRQHRGSSGAPGTPEVVAASSVGSNPRLSVARLLPDGHRDATFGVEADDDRQWEPFSGREPGPAR